MKQIKVRTLRNLTAGLVVLAVVGAGACRISGGNLCSVGIDPFAFSCPLGSLELALASWTLVPPLWLSVLLVVLSVVLLGRVFCAWICPVPLLRNLFGNGNARTTRPLPRVLPSSNPGSDRTAAAVLNAPLKKWNWETYSPYAVLTGALVSSFLFGFPVFCLVCPIGLFFGTMFAVLRLFSIHQPGLELVLWPAILVAEVFLLRKWCRAICPLGALLRLVSKLNRFVQPTVNSKQCLAARGAHCQVCQKACPEGIDIPSLKTGSLFRDCTKCLECREKCPVQAIQLRWLA